jgi:hypothetical protein
LLAPDKKYLNEATSLKMMNRTVHKHSSLANAAVVEFAPGKNYLNDANFLK